MIKLHSPDNESELVILKSLLDAEQIHYYVLNDHFGTLKVGPRIDLFNAKVVYVSENDYESAKDILTDFRANVGDGDKPFVSRYSFPDKIRMVIEALLFGWFIPGNRWMRKIDEISTR